MKIIVKKKKIEEIKILNPFTFFTKRKEQKSYTEFTNKIIDSVNKFINTTNQLQVNKILAIASETRSYENELSAKSAIASINKAAMSYDFYLYKLYFELGQIIPNDVSFKKYADELLKRIGFMKNFQTLSGDKLENFIRLNPEYQRYQDLKQISKETRGGIANFAVIKFEPEKYISSDQDTINSVIYDYVRDQGKYTAENRGIVFLAERYGDIINYNFEQLKKLITPLDQSISIASRFIVIPNSSRKPLSKTELTKFGGEIISAHKAKIAAGNMPANVPTTNPSSRTTEPKTTAAPEPKPTAPAPVRQPVAQNRTTR